LFSFYFIKKAVCFETFDRLFLYKFKPFFSKSNHFCRGKAPFIFNQGRFIADCLPSLQTSITKVLNPARLDALAREHGFLQRKSKFKPEEFIDLLAFSEFDHSQLSLQDCCNDLALQHGKSLSKVGLHKRFNKQGLDFVKAVLAAQIASKLDFGDSNSWQPFNSVKIADSCKFSMPKAYMDAYPGFGGGRGESALMNIQYTLDLKCGSWESLEFTKATQNDQGYSKKTLDQIHKGDLLIRDLGYVTREYLSKVVQQKAFFINRLPPRWKPVETRTGKIIDWPSLYLRMQTGKISQFETIVTIGTGKDAFDCRLIAAPVPEQVWAERIRKAQKHAESKGVAVSDEYKERCRFSIFITNTTIEIISTADVVQLYRLRWQIELIFKTWKSLIGIHKVKVVNIQRLECQLVARFIWILLNWAVFRCIDSFIKTTTPGYSCSIWKFFKHARNYSQALRKAVTGQINFSDWYKLFIGPTIKNLLIEPKKGKKPAFAIVYDAFNP
jgi:hypothetical protein